jgi:predicted nucleic acid-binding protein
MSLSRSFSSAGVSREILDLALEGAVELYISQPIIDELRGVLYEKFTGRQNGSTMRRRRYCDSAGSSIPESR